MRRIDKNIGGHIGCQLPASAAGCGKKTEESPPAQMVKTIKPVAA